MAGGAAQLDGEPIATVAMAQLNRGTVGARAPAIAPLHERDDDRGRIQPLLGEVMVEEVTDAVLNAERGAQLVS